MKLQISITRISPDEYKIIVQDLTKTIVTFVGTYAGACTFLAKHIPELQVIR